MSEATAVCDGDARGPRPRCPLCGWQARPGETWYCDCGHAWDTFETRGRCPACGYRWTETECHACCRMSPHEDWYGPQTTRAGGATLA